MTQPEAKFKHKLCDSYEDVFPEGWHFYFSAAVKFGVPDLYFTVGGKGVWVEAKIGDNTLSKIQRIQIERMRSCGERVIVLWLQNPDEPKQKRWVEFTPFDDVDTSYKTVMKYSLMKTPEFWAAIGGVQL